MNASQRCICLAKALLCVAIENLRNFCTCDVHSNTFLGYYIKSLSYSLSFKFHPFVKARHSIFISSAVGVNMVCGSGLRAVAMAAQVRLKGASKVDRQEKSVQIKE